MNYFNLSNIQQKPGVTDHEIYELVGRAAVVKRDIVSVTRVVMQGEDRVTSHYHKNTEEIYVVLQGAGTMMVECEILQLKQGDVIVLHQGESHSLSLSAGETIEFLAISHPAFTMEDHYAS